MTEGALGFSIGDDRLLLICQECKIRINLVRLLGGGSRWGKDARSVDAFVNKHSSCEPGIVATTESALDECGENIKDYQPHPPLEGNMMNYGLYCEHHHCDMHATWHLGTLPLEPHVPLIVRHTGDLAEHDRDLITSTIHAVFPDHKILPLKAGVELEVMCGSCAAQLERSKK